MMNGYEAYMKELAQQMRAELTDNGFTSLETSDDVNQYMPVSYTHLTLPTSDLV